MELQELAARIDGTILNPAAAGRGRVDRVYAGSRMSDLLREASDGTLVMTHLANDMVIRAAGLVDVPGICFVDGATPTPAMVAAAASQGTAILSCPHSLDKALQSLRDCLPGGAA